MSDKITRRDFINGTLVAAGASLFPLDSFAAEAGKTLDPAYYPPALTGLRGSHPGSHEAAHDRAWAGKSNWGKTKEVDTEYDLIVVGAGISGLAAARFYQKEYGEDKKILILDNHDDFGGHAKRNEHTIDGVMKIGYGGAQTLESPSRYGNNTRDILADINVEVDEFFTAYDRTFYKRHGLDYVTFFNERTFGKDKVVPCKIGDYAYTMDGVGPVQLTVEEGLKDIPLSDEGRKQLLSLIQGGDDPLKDIPVEDRAKYLQETRYFDVLRDKFGITDPLIYEIVRSIPNDLASSGTDVMSAMEATWQGAPGFTKEMMADIFGGGRRRRNDDEEREEDPYIHHFPSGNAGVARLMVRKLIPGVADGDTMDDVVLARFKYDQLDLEENVVRLRLNSTVVEAMHDGDPDTADRVHVKYINDRKAYSVTGKHVIMACYNMVIPHIVPGLPKEQHDALRRSTKSPLVYTTVGLRNWKAWKEKHIGIAACPGNWHQIVFIDYPVSMGGYEYSANEDEPILINMIHIPYGEEYGVTPREQFKECRLRLLSLTFDDFEQEIKGHLSGMLDGTGFDPDEDIASITVNRWAHGYAWGGTRLHEPDMRQNAAIGRKQFGRITIANSDAAPGAIIHAAIDQAKRAVDEIKV